MTINQAFNILLKNWPDQKKSFRSKYAPYRSKYLKHKKDPDAEGIGYWKKVELLEAAGYIEIKIKVKPSKK